MRDHRIPGAIILVGGLLAWAISGDMTMFSMSIAFALIWSIR